MAEEVNFEYDPFGVLEKKKKKEKVMKKVYLIVVVTIEFLIMLYLILAYLRVVPFF